MNVRGEILSVVMVPHPPIMIKEIARDEYPKVKQTANAMESIASEISLLDPEAIIIITPHGPVFSDAIAIYEADKLYGDLSRFGVSSVKVNMPFDRNLAQAIISEAGKYNIYTSMLDAKSLRAYGLSAELDHGVVAPLAFFSTPLPAAVIMSMGLFPPVELYSFGIALQEAIAKSGKKVVVIVSGDLSHRINPSAPGGYHEHGEIFDEEVYNALKDGDFSALFDIPQEVCENAGECGYRSLLMGLGALEGLAVNSKIYSYQAPFGVGYLVASFRPCGEDNARNILPKLKEKQHTEITKARINESLPVQLARMTVEHFVKHNKPISANILNIEQKGRAGVFVSIKKSGQLRGCIGTTTATTASITDEIIRNAVAAATNDPRFNPITSDELQYLTYSVDVLTDAVPVKDFAKLDPKKYGVIVSSGNKSGLLLPDLEGVNTVQEQIDIALQKAGISPQESYEIFKFEVIRYK